VALGSKILAIGGYGSGNLAIVEEYHPELNLWTTKGPGLLVPRHFLSVVSVPANWFSSLPGGCGGVH
jgi:hypothetical protein